MLPCSCDKCILVLSHAFKLQIEGCGHATLLSSYLKGRHSIVDLMKRGHVLNGQGAPFERAEQG